MNGNFVNGNSVNGNLVNDNSFNGNSVNGNSVNGNSVNGNSVNGNSVNSNLVNGNCAQIQWNWYTTSSIGNGQYCHPAKEKDPKIYKVDNSKAPSQILRLGWHNRYSVQYHFRHLVSLQQASMLVVVRLHKI